MSKITTILDLKILGTEKLVNLEKEIQSTEAALKKLDKTDKKNAKTIAEKRVQLKGLRSERNTEQKTVLAVNTATKKLDGSYNGLVKRNKALLTSLKASKGGMKGNSAEITKMKEEYKKNNEKLKEFDKSLGNNQRNVGNYGSALGNLREKMGQMGLAAGAVMMAFAALSRTVGLLTVDFSEFEKSLTNVLTLMSGEEVTQFHDKLQEGAIDIIADYGFAINDVNKALFDSVSAGVPAAQSIEFMNTASDLALGGVTDLSTAVDGMTTIMNAFQLSQDEANKIASAFFTAQKFGKTTVEELSNSIGNVAPHAKRAGMSYQELLAAMAELTKQGIKTDLAATALKSTITAIEKPSQKAMDAFDKLGISYGTGAIKSQGLMNILTQITAASEDNADILTELIPNIRALTGVSAMGAAQMEDYDKILKEVNKDYGETSSLSNAVSMQQKTLAQSQARLNGEWTKQKILVGEKVKPIFTAFNDVLTFFIKNLDTIWAILKGVAVTMVVYNSALIVSTIKTGLQTAATWLQVTAQRALNVAMKANPMGLLLGLGAGAITMFASMGKETGRTAEQQEKLNKQQEEYNRIKKEEQDVLAKRKADEGNEIARLLQLTRVIKDTNREQSERKSALDDLNKIAGTNITNLSNEAQLVKELDVAYENAVNSIKAKYILQAAEEDILKLLKKELEHGEDIEGLDKTKVKEQTKINKLLDDKLKLEQQINNASTSEEKIELNKKLKSTTNDLEFAERRLGGMKKAQEVLTEKVTDKQDEQNDIMEKATKLIDGLNIKKTIKATLDSSELTAYQKLKERIKLANAELHKQIALGGDTTEATKELLDAKQELADHEEKFQSLTETSTDVSLEEVNALKKRIKENGKYIEVIKNVNEAETEYNNAHIKQLKDKIALILLQAKASGELTSQQIEDLGLLQTELDKFQATLKDPETQMSPLENAMYGEGVKEAFALAGTALDTLSQMMDGRSQLDKVKFDNQMHYLNTEKEAELKKFDESTKASKMSEEDKTKAREKITKKHDTKILALKLEEFERNKKLELNEARIAGAMAIMRIWSGEITGNPVVDAIIKAGLAIAQVRRTSQQMKAINATEFKGEKGGVIPFGKGGMVHGNRHAQGGVKFDVGGRVAELEGGEAVINRRSTEMFRHQLSAMNVAGGGKKFADGGLVMGALAKAQTRSLLTEDDIVGIASALSHQKVTVTESEITGTQNTISVLESRATF